MQYESLAPITQEQYDEIIITGSEADREAAVLRLGLFSESQAIAEASCLKALSDPAANVQSAAALAIGHLARRFQAIDPETERTVRGRANDAWMSARVSDALDDINHFTGRQVDATPEEEVECPVCGFAPLHERPWRDDSPSDEICPACGIQFGLDDAGPGGADARTGYYAAFRQQWRANGYPWFSPSRTPAPGWDPKGRFGDPSG